MRPQYKLLVLFLLSIVLLYLAKTILIPKTLSLADFHAIYEMDPLIEKYIKVPLVAGQSPVVNVHYKELAASKTLNDNVEPKIDVLLLHGKKFNSKTWLDLKTMEALAERGYRVIAVDLPGFGRSEAAASLDGDDDQGFKNRATFLKSLIGALHLHRPAVVSPSMSGAFALPLLVSRPDLFGAFVPVAPVYTARYSSEIYMRTRVPTLIVVGDLDTNLGVISVKNLKNLPWHKIVTLPNSRHPAYLDQPEMWHQSLIEFLQNLNKFN